MDLDVSFHDLFSDEETANAVLEIEKTVRKKNENEIIKKEERNKFINTVLKYVKPDPNVSYRCDLSLLDYSKISEDMNGIPIEQCRKKLLKIIKPLTKEKSLHQVLNDTLYNLTKVHYGKTKGYTVFLITNAKAINNVIKEKKLRMGNLHLIGNSMWNKLTMTEKLAYEGIKALGKTPIDLYHEYAREENCYLTLNQTKRVWGTLPMSEREYFIRKSAEMKMNLENLYEKEQHENFDEILGPNERELSDYLAVHNMPERPSMSLHLAYLTKSGQYNEDDHLHVGKLIKIANEKFSKLSDEEKYNFKKKFLKSHEKYERRFKKWEGRLDEIEKFMLKLLQQMHKNKRKIATESSKVKSLDDFHSVVMPAVKVNFKIKPSDVPLTIRDVYVYKQEIKKETGKDISYNEAIKKVTKLGQIEKTRLEAKAEKNKDDFINEVKSFVGSLSEAIRKIYLGQYRFRFMQALKEDIFENDYPNSKYPIFINPSQSKEENKKTVHPEVKIAPKVKKQNDSVKKLEKQIESSLSEIFDDIPISKLASSASFKKTRSVRKLEKQIESSLSEIFEDISISKHASSACFKENHSETCNKKNDEVDRNNNSPKKRKKDSVSKLKKETEKIVEVPNENSKRKRNNSSSESTKNKRRKLNDDELKPMVKINFDSDDEDEEEDTNLQNISEYLNSIEFENTQIKFEEIVKEEQELDWSEY